MTTAKNQKTVEPAQTEVVAAGPVDVAAFMREIAAQNAALADRIAAFRTQHADKLTNDEKANLKGLSAGHRRIANTLNNDYKAE